MRKNPKVQRILYRVVIVILIGVILYCAGTIAFMFISREQEQAKIDELLATMPSVEQPTVPTGDNVTIPTYPTDPEEDKVKPRPVYPESEILFQYRALYEINNDMVGFIEIPGTRVRYPVLQSPTKPNYYLTRDFYKAGADSGSIYVREACDVNKPSDNVTIYGHRMINGTMFSDLHKYKDEWFFKQNRYIYFNTLTEYHTYEIFAVFQLEVNTVNSFNYHLFDDAENKDEFDQFVTSCKALSYYDTGITPEYGQKLITLSTCDRSIEDGRLVVVARRIM
jgi:sortase B